MTTSNNQFNPVHNAHAIVEMIVFFQFHQGALDPHKDRLLEIREELSEEFPAYSSIQAFQIDIPSDGNPSFHPKIGFELRRLKEDASIEWLIRLDSDSISIHCLDYSRWNYVWPKIQKYSKIILEKLEKGDVSPSAIGLKYVDQFVFQGEPKDYDISNLFKRDSLILHPRSFSSACQWHSHSGWFEEIAGLGDVLNQINIDSVIYEPKRYIISIDHTCIYYNPTENALLYNQGFHQIFAEGIHKLNKSLLGDLLTDNMQQRINLGWEVM